MLEGAYIAGGASKKRAAHLSGFFVVVDFVELAFFVLSLLDELTVAVDVDVEVLVELDDALVGTGLLLDGAVADAEGIGKLEVVAL